MRKIVIHPDFEKYSAFIEAIPDIFSSEGVTIYKDRNEVKIFDVEGLEFVVKSFKIPHFINKIAYSFIRSSKAERSYTNALEITRKGVLTPTPMAYIEIKKSGLLFNSFYISGKSQYQRELRELSLSPDLPEAYPVLDSFARFTAALHDKGIYHKDYTPGNILFGKTGDSYSFELIDINRMKFCEIDLKMGCQNFSKLCILDDFYRFVAQKYALARGYDVNEAVELMIKYRDPDA